MNATDRTGLETVDVSVYDGIGGGVSISYSASEGWVISLEIGFGVGINTSYTGDTIAVRRDNYGQAEGTMSLFIEDEINAFGVHVSSHLESTQSCKIGQLGFGPIERGLIYPV